MNPESRIESLFPSAELSDAFAAHGGGAGLPASLQRRGEVAHAARDSAAPAPRARGGRRRPASRRRRFLRHGHRAAGVRGEMLQVNPFLVLSDFEPTPSGGRPLPRCRRVLRHGRCLPG